MRDKWFIWNPSNCECECDKSCDIGEYLAIRKKILDKLVDECNETIDEEVETIDNNKNKCDSCIVYIVLFSIFLQLILELVLILFTINTQIVIKEMFINIMTMFIMRNEKWEKSSKLTLKNRT